MGALLGQQVTGHELGIAPVVPGIIAGGAAGGVIAKIFGGGKRSCKGKQGEVKKAINQYLTYSDRRDLVAGTESKVAPTPVDMAWFYVGGKDCKHKNVSPGDQRFLNRLPQLIQQRATEQQQAQQQKNQPAGNSQNTGNNNGGSDSGSQKNGGGQSNGGSGSEQAMDDTTMYIALGAGALILIGGVIALSG